MDTDFDRTEANKLYAKLTTQKDRALAERDHLVNRIAGIDSMLAGLLTLYPDMEGTVASTDGGDAKPEKVRRLVLPTNRPTGLSSVDAVVTVVNELSTDAPLSVQEIHDELQRRNWLPSSGQPLNAVRTALARAAHNDRVVQVRLTGRSKGYRAIPQDAESPALAGLSDGVATTGSGGDSHTQIDQDHGSSASSADRDHRGGASIGSFTV